MALKNKPGVPARADLVDKTTRIVRQLQDTPPPMNENQRRLRDEAGIELGGFDEHPTAQVVSWLRVHPNGDNPRALTNMERWAVDLGLVVEVE